MTYEEKENFGQIKERLRILLEKHLTNFRFVYPFGRPEGALKATISLLERVSTALCVIFLNLVSLFSPLCVFRYLHDYLKG